MTSTTGDYPFAKEYAAWGWFKSTATCGEDATIFRIVIDTPEEGNNNGENPNFSEDTWSADLNEVGNNVLVAKVIDGKVKLFTYTFGIQ